MPRMTDSRIDELFRVALDERADALLPLAGGESVVATRLERADARRRFRRQVGLVLLAAALLVAATLAAAVGSKLIKLPVANGTPPANAVLPSASAAPTLVATVPSDELSSPGQLLVCDDLSWPPQAFTDAQGSPAGVDVDIFAAIAQRLGLQLRVVNARFDPNGNSEQQAATGGTCDVIVGDAFVDIHGFGPAGMDTMAYLGEGWGYVVRAGDADAFSTPVSPRAEFLCGKTVGEVGTGDITMQGIMDDCRLAGHPITVKSFAANDDAVRALLAGDVMAYYADLRVAGPDVLQHPGQLELAHPEGVGFTDFAVVSVAAQKTGLSGALQAALDSIAGDGTYDRILQQWGLQPSALCAADMVVNRGPSQTCLVPVTSSTPASTVPALSVSGWHEPDPDPLANLAEPYAVAWSGSRFVVAGVVPGPGFSHAHPPVQFWTSPDGQTWRLSQVPSTGYPQAYAFGGNAGVAVGSDGSQAAVWTSPDSQTWTRLSNPPALTPSGQEAGLQLNHVVHGPAGYVALGELDMRTSQGDTGQALVVWSTDGRDWHRAPMTPFGDAEFANLTAVVVVDGRYVIAGDEGGSPNAPGPTLWTSTDGRAWTVEPALANPPDVYMDLVAGAHGALLAGTGSGPLRGSQQCTLWASSDGLTWNAVGDCPEGLGSPGLVATPFGFAATEAVVGACTSSCASPTQFPCNGGVLVSATGARWTCVPPPPAGPLPPASTVAASRHRILSVLGGIWIADVTPGG